MSNDVTVRRSPRAGDKAGAGRFVVVLEAAESDLLNRRMVTIPEKDWARFEAWASAPAREVPALRRLSKTRPVWQK